MSALWLQPYWSDLATVAASTTSGSLAAANVQTAEPSQVWRSTAGSGSYLDFDFGASGSIACTAIALIGVNLGASDTMSIFASNTSSASARGGAAISTGNAYIAKSTESAWPFHIAFRKFSNASSFRYWSVTFPSVAGSTVEVGRAMLGAHHTPTVGLDVEWGGISMESADSRDRTAYNKAMIARRGNAARRMDVIYSNVNKSELLRGALRLGRLRGNGGDLFFSLDPDDATYFPEYSMQCTFEQIASAPVARFDGSGDQYWSLRTSLLEVV